jgi:hypothetical protein
MLSDEVRARMIAHRNSIHAIYIEKKYEAHRKNRKKGSTKKQPKGSYEGATKEYLRRVSLQLIYC